LDQLERRYCKDTPFFRPFYIGAPKGPFLPGLSTEREYKEDYIFSLVRIFSIFSAPSSSQSANTTIMAPSLQALKFI
jgi:hypothetical protein